jgi:hypothetical protein
VTHEEVLSHSFAGLQVSSDFSEALLQLRDNSKLQFCHRVGQRWAKAVGADGTDKEPGAAGEVLARIAMFRLNAKHLDIQFQDGSRWEAQFQDSRRGGTV